MRERRPKHDDAHNPQPRRAASSRGATSALIPWPRQEMVLPETAWQHLLQRARLAAWACFVVGMDRKTARHSAIDALAEERLAKRFDLGSNP
jgi:hypothetical protein